MTAPLARSKARIAGVLLTAAAVLLPLPASGFACSRGPSDCPRCAAVAKEAASKPKPSSCCRRHAAARRVESLEQSDDSGQQRGNAECCCKQPAELPLQTAPVSAPSTELVAGLPTYFASIAAAPADLSAAPIDPADLYPRIPHCILHCSWQI
jgi:hypothetical protein